MPKMTRNDLRYQYKWTVTDGDNPKLIANDSHHLSRNEGYEMLLYLNSLSGNNSVDLSIRTRQIVEWMLKEHFVSTAPGREAVTDWVVTNFDRLAPQYPG